MPSLDDAKKAAGYAAAELVQEGMLVGLGTGSTAAYFIERLAERCQKGLLITAVATSHKTQSLAQEMEIPLVDSGDIVSLDLTVDGADEIDPQKRMIKGAGGALLREKILASISLEMVVVISHDKMVAHLGKVPLPIEIAPFAWRSTIHKLEKLELSGQLRTRGPIPFVTDNGNYIYDISLPDPLRHPEKIHQLIQEIPGVIETGFFFNLAKKILIGYPDGSVKIQA